MILLERIVMLHTIEIESGRRIELIDITGQINSIIKKSGISEGICFLHVPHTTAAITINENADPDVSHDILDKTKSLIPPDDNYAHLEGNSDSHIKSSLFGAAINLIINNGRLLLGRWQCVYFCEFDGPRNRSVNIKLISG
jgi:secondary thiamine-phosphate synthase enzyme